MYSASFVRSRLTMSAASPTCFAGLTCLADGREGCGGTTTCEHSAIVIRGSAMRHNWRATNTSFGDGLGGTRKQLTPGTSSPLSLPHL